MAKATTTSDPLTTTIDPKTDPAGAAGLAAAAEAGIKSPSDISGTEMPTAENLEGRVLRLEALVAHVIETSFRGADPEKLVEEWILRQKGSELLDPTAKGRA